LATDANVSLGITEFSNEATEMTAINSGRQRIHSVIPDNQYQDIKDYFARPRLVTKFNASTTRSILYNFNVFDWVNDFWPAAAINRLNGVFAYRAKAKITLTLAATPFQQGLVTVGFQYAGNTSGSTLCRQVYPPLSTNVPHARLNFADTTIAELDIPYVNGYDYIEFANGTAGGGDAYRYPYGHLAVVQQLPYVALAATTAPRLSLYISLVDMELFGAVPVSLNAVIPQSGLETMNREARRTKVVSRSLSSVSEGAASVSKLAGSVGIPALSSVASGVSWMADKLAGTAKSFGYSNPIVETPPEKELLLVSACDSNVDVPDASCVVAPFSSNRLDVTPVDGSTIDEMSMPYVLRQWNQVFVGSMTTSLTDGTFVYATRCCPTNFWFRTNAGTPGGNIALPASSSISTNCVAPSTLCYLGTMFRYFRGGLKFRFTFAKTKFHAGRIVASFVPSTQDFFDPSLGTSIVPLPEVSAGVGLQPFTSSAIFDLKDDSVFEFHVPYVCARPHLSTYGSFGGVSLAVLDVLRTTGETSTTISFMVEVCAADDFEFSNYVGTGVIPLTGPNVNSTAVVLQSGLDALETLHDKTEEVVQFTMGEKISSLKELIMIPAYSQSFVNSGEAANTVLPPWTYYPPLVLTAPPQVVTAPFIFGTHPGNMVSSMYAFASGGTTYHAFTNSPDQYLFIRQVTLDGNIVSSGTSDPRNRFSSTLPRHYAGGSAAVSVHAKCPSYQKTVMVPRDQHGFLNGGFVWRSFSATKPSYFMNSAYVLGSYNGKASGTQVMLVTMGYCASDDAKGHHFIGPPLILLPSSTSTAFVGEATGNY
jgi:hypothetical protein